MIRRPHGVCLRRSEMRSEVGDLGSRQEMNLSSVEVLDRGLQENAVSTTCYVNGRDSDGFERKLDL
jgi:hypothetical protein